MNKKGATDWFKTGIFLLLVGLFLNQVSPGLFSGIFGTTPADKDAGYKDGFCSAEDTTVTLDAVEKYTNGAMSGSNYYYINGGPQSSVTDGGTFTASPGDELSIYYQLESPMHYTTVELATIPCKGTKTYRGDVWQHQSGGGAAGAVTEGLTIRIFSEDNGDLISITNNETLAAGDLVNLDFVVQGSYENGMPYGATVVFEYNSTNFDEVKVVGGGWTPATTPTVFTGLSLPNFKTVAFKMPPIDSNQKITATIVLDVSDSTNPAAGGAKGLDSIHMSLYDWDYFTLDTGQIGGPGPEDTDDWSNVGNSTTIFYANNITYD